MPLGLAVRRTIVAAVAAAALLFAGLTLQMTRGEDPALGSRSATSPEGVASSASLVQSGDDGNDDGGSGYIAPEQAPAPAPVQTRAS